MLTVRKNIAKTVSGNAQTADNYFGSRATAINIVFPCCVYGFLDFKHLRVLCYPFDTVKSQTMFDLSCVTWPCYAYAVSVHVTPTPSTDQLHLFFFRLYSRLVELVKLF